MLRIEYVIEHDPWHTCTPEIKRFTRKIALATFQHLKLEGNHSFTILLTHDQAIKRLNHEFRGKNHATNVLSFADSIPLKNGLYIGDIAISYQRIADEALEQNKIFKNHYAHMIVHGILHLLGYDHITDDQAVIMEGLEAVILSKFKIPNPYEQYVD